MKLVKHNCEFCNKECSTPLAWYKRSKTHCCSKTCSTKLKSKQALKVGKCFNCGSEIVKLKNHKLSKYCSKECRVTAFENLQINCTNCSKLFKTSRCRVEVNKNNFCSKDCKTNYRKRITERKEHTCKHCSVTFYKKQSEVDRANIKNYSLSFCCVSCKNKYFKGENHPNYKPLLYRNNDKQKLKLWSKLVKIKDNFTCVECGYNKNINHLQAHHIKNYKQFVELRFDVNNGVTLCLQCHSEKHPELKNLILCKLKKLENEI